ncbi:MAG: MFS transporter [Proteobacteria bacterium]|nr:MFS transporter [Pseudomonadota bacterium]
MDKKQKDSISLKAKALRYRWLIFSILSLGYVLVYFHRLCPAVLAVDLMRDLKASGALAGLLSAAYFYPYAIMQFPAGLLADSWGPRKTITLFFIIAFFGSMLLGLSSSVVPAIIGRALVGLGVAMLFVPTLKIIAEWFHVREFAFMTGILMAMGGVGSLSAATPLVWLSSSIGWRNAFIVIGMFTLLLAILVWVFVRNRPSDFGWPSPFDSVKKESESVAPGLMEGAKKVLSNRHFWPLAIWFFFNCGIFFAIGGLWGGPYLMHAYQMDKSESGHILSMIAFGMVIGSPLLSYLSDHIFKGRKPVLVFASAAMLVIMGVFFFFTDTIPLPGLYLLFFFLSIFSSAVVTIGFTTNKELFPVSISGTATGLINLFPFVGGAVFQPVLGGVLEHYGKLNGMFTLAGYKACFLLLLGAAGIAFMSSLMLKETLYEVS